MAGLNNSIFNLPAKLEDVRVAEDVIKVSTRKIIPKSASKKGAFPGSDVTFDFTLSGNQHWLPSRSFVVIRDSIYVGRTVAAAADTPDQPNLNDDVAPAMNCQDNLWDGCQLTIGGFSLGSRTKLTPQISAINKRIMKSGSYLDTQGSSAQCWDPEFYKRQNDITELGIVGDAAAITYDVLAGTVEIAAGGIINGTNTLFTEDLQEGDQIRIDAGGAGQIVANINVITSDILMLIAIEPTITLGAGKTIEKCSQGIPTSRSNRNERIYVPPLGIFHQGKALKVW